MLYMINNMLVMITQEQVNKKPSLMADVIDSQIVKTIENSKI